MPYNGSGNYSPPGPPTFPAVAGNIISSSYFNAIINDIADALDIVVTRSGQTGVTITDVVAAPTAAPGRSSAASSRTNFA